MKEFKIITGSSLECEGALNILNKTHKIEVIEMVNRSQWGIAILMTIEERDNWPGK